MDRNSDTLKDLRLAAIAPAVLGHAIALAIFFSLAPIKSSVPADPMPMEVTLVDESIIPVSVWLEPEDEILADQDQAGLSSDPDPRLGQPEGGAVEQAEILEDLPFEALSGTDTAETLVPGVTVPAQAATEAGRLGEGGDRLSAIRMALRLHACQKLTERRDPTCPKEDPFVRQVRLANLRNAPQLLPTQAKILGPESYTDIFMARNQTVPENLPAGMDLSLFASAMRPGAYNAQRIRDGLTPLWQTALERDLASSSVN